MKKILVVLFMTTGFLAAQEQVLFGRITSHGGFGGPVVKLSQFDSNLGVLAGGRGGWIIGHKLTLGGGGYGLANDIPVLYDGTDSTRYLDFNYGGFEMGIIIASNRLRRSGFNPKPMNSMPWSKAKTRTSAGSACMKAYRSRPWVIICTRARSTNPFPRIADTLSTDIGFSFRMEKSGPGRLAGVKP